MRFAIVIFLRIAMKSCFKNEEFQHKADIKCQFFPKTPGSMTHLSSSLRMTLPRNPPCRATVVTSPCCNTSSAANGARSLKAKLTRPVARPKARRCGTAGNLPCVRNSKVFPASGFGGDFRPFPKPTFWGLVWKRGGEKRWLKLEF